MDSQHCALLAWSSEGRGRPAEPSGSQYAFYVAFPGTRDDILCLFCSAISISPQQLADTGRGQGAVVFQDRPLRQHPGGREGGAHPHTFRVES